MHQLQLTITDFVLEIHDTHHPLGPSLYYEDQKAPAKKRTEEFWDERVPKYLGYFEGLLKDNGGTYVTGRAHHLCRSVAVPDRGRAALRLSQADEGVREARFRAWSTCATASRRGRRSRRIWRASAGFPSTRKASSGTTRSWICDSVIPGRVRRARPGIQSPGAQLRTMVRAGARPGMTSSTDSAHRSASSRASRARCHRCSSHSAPPPRCRRACCRARTRRRRNRRRADAGSRAC